MMPTGTIRRLVSILALALFVSACNKQPWGLRLEPSRTARAEGTLRDDWVYQVTLLWPCPVPPPTGRRYTLVTELERAGIAWSLEYADGTPIARARGLGDTMSRSFDGKRCRVFLAEVTGKGGVAHLEATIERMPEALAGKKLLLMLERDTRPEVMPEGAVP